MIEVKHYRLKNIMRKIEIQLTIANNFISSIENDEKCVIRSESDNIKIMINDEADEVIKELSNSFKCRYQNNFESMKGREFFFNYVHFLSYNIIKNYELWWIIYRFS